MVEKLESDVESDDDDDEDEDEDELEDEDEDDESELDESLDSDDSSNESANVVTADSETESESLLDDDDDDEDDDESVPNSDVERHAESESVSPGLQVHSGGTPPRQLSMPTIVRPLRRFRRCSHASAASFAVHSVSRSGRMRAPNCTRISLFCWARASNNKASVIAVWRAAHDQASMSCEIEKTRQIVAVGHQRRGRRCCSSARRRQSQQIGRARAAAHCCNV